MGGFIVKLIIIVHRKRAILRRGRVRILGQRHALNAQPELGESLGRILLGKGGVDDLFAVKKLIGGELDGKSNARGLLAFAIQLDPNGGKLTPSQDLRIGGIGENRATAFLNYLKKKKKIEEDSMAWAFRGSVESALGMRVMIGYQGRARSGEL